MPIKNLVTIRFPIVKPVLPNIDRYQRFIESAFERCWLTNNGPLLQELELRLKEYLELDNLLLVANGTLALQVAYKSLCTEGDVATSPFSFAATASSLAWQNHTPVFCDVDENTFNVSPEYLLEATKKSGADISTFVGVHVFGNASDVREMDHFAKQHSLKVIYDGAHAFGVKRGGKSALSYGDAATLSLHATKIFHCVEGGAITFRDREALARAKQMINFGFDAEGRPENVGINAKMSEMHAAMGLALFDDIDKIIEHRVSCVQAYKHYLDGKVRFQEWDQNCSENGAYMPVVFDSERQLLDVMGFLIEKGVQTRRYFYPSLSEVPVYKGLGNTPNSNELSRKILCLPLYFDLKLEEVQEICQLVIESLGFEQ